MHDTTVSDHTRISTWKFMNSVLYRKWVVWHMNKWSYIYSIILWTYRTGFLETWKVSLFLHCTAPCTLLRNVRNCRPLPTASYIHMKYTTLALWNYMYNKTLCYVQHICKKLNFHNGMKTTVPLSNTRLCCVTDFLSCMKHTRTCI
jgi:hypothetical protein